jgi:hypothetical protein
MSALFHVSTPFNITLFCLLKCPKYHKFLLFISFFFKEKG